MIILSCEKDGELESYAIDFPAAYVVCGDNSVHVINLATAETDTVFKLNVPQATFAHHIYKTADEKFLSIASPYFDFSYGHNALHSIQVNGGITILDAKSGKTKSHFTVPFANSNAIVSKDGKEIWTTLFSHSAALLIYDFETNKLIKEVTLDADPSEIIFSEDYKFAFVACEESSFVTVVDTETKEVLKKIKVDLFPTNVWRGNENTILVENKNKRSINLIDVSKLAAVEAIDPPFTPGFMGINPSTNELWVCKYNTNLVSNISKINGKWEYQKDVHSANGVHSLAFYENGNKAIIINQEANSVSIADTKTKEIIKEIAVGQKPNGVAIIE